jgi:Putative DNA-binding domain
MLDDVQRSFARALNGNRDADIVALISEEGVNPLARFSIYQSNVVHRLTAALVSTYPVVCRLVDRGFFDYAADTFIRRTLPASSCLDEYGEEFPSFLETFPPATETPYLSDVARLEWHIGRVVRGPRHPNVPVITLLQKLERFIQVGDEASNIYFRFSPDVRFLRSRFAIDTIWKMHQEGALMNGLSLDSPGANLQIRGGDRLCLSNLSLPAWDFRSQLGRGANLEAAFSAATATCADFDCPLEIATLLNDGCVIEITAEPPCPAIDHQKNERGAGV